MDNKITRERSLFLIGDPIQTVLQAPKNQKWVTNKIDKLLEYLPVVEPNSRTYVISDLVIGIVIVYYYFQIGLVLTFGEAFWEAELSSPWFIALNICNILLLWADIVLSLKKGYYKQGILVTAQSSISREYSSLKLVNSLFSAAIITISFGSGLYVLNYVKIGFLFRLFTLSEIDSNIERRLQLSLKLSTVYMIARLFVIMFLIGHYLGLIYYILDRYLLVNNYFGPNTPNMCWLYNAQAYGDLFSASWDTQYLYIMYWSTNYLTSIAFGDIPPLNHLEGLFLGLVCVFSIIHFNYFVNIIIGILVQYNSYNKNYMQKLSYVTQTINGRVSSDTCSKVMSSCETMWKDQINRDQVDQILALLPPKLQCQLLGQVYSKFVRQTRLLPLFSDSFVQQLIFKIKEREYSPGQTLCTSMSTSSQKLCYIKSGSVSFYFSQNLIQTLSTGHFGMLEFISGKQSRFSARAKSMCVVFELERPDLVKLAYQCQLYKERLRYLIDVIDSGNLQEITDLRCLVCQNDHLTQECPQINYIPPRDQKVTQERLYSARKDRGNRKNVTKVSAMQKSNLKRSHDRSTQSDAPQTFEFHMEETKRMISALESNINRTQVNTGVRRDYKHYYPHWNLSALFHLSNET